MDRIQKRFDELFADVKKIDETITTTKESGRRSTITRTRLNTPLLNQWVTSVKALLYRLLGDSDPTYLDFDKHTNRRGTEAYIRFQRLRPLFMSAKEQFEGGYLFDVQNLIHAEVFSNELELAELFLKKKYEVAAAVTAGVVLETTIKKLCTQQSPPISLTGNTGKGKKTDTLISDLKNATTINEAVAKQLRAWMNVRNDAAHGTRGNGDFDKGEIRRMIDGVQDFVAKHMA